MTDSLKGKSIFISGGTGFIGSHLSRRLVNESAEVSILARGNSSLDLISDIVKKVRIHNSEITDINYLLKIIKKTSPKIVFHLAARINAGSGFESLTSLIDVNLLGTINILKAAYEAGSVKKIVFIGTSDVYGSMEIPYSENSAVNPISAYAASKASAELFCRYLAAEYRIPLVILRPFIVYGEGQSPDMFIPQLIQSALKGKDFSMTGGEQTRDFLYINDFVDACIRAGLRKEAEGEIINVASGKEILLADVAEKIMSLLDNPVKIRFGALPYRENERWRVRADIKKAKRLLGWKPETSINEGLKKTIHCYENNRERLQ